MKTKVTIQIKDVQIEELSPLVLLKRLVALKKDLEEMGCEVALTIDDIEIDGVRATDLPETKTGK